MGSIRSWGWSPHELGWCPYKRIPELLYGCLRIKHGVSSLQPSIGFSPRTWLFWYSDLGFPAPRIMWNKLMLFICHPILGVLLKLSELTKTPWDFNTAPLRTTFWEPLLLANLNLSKIKTITPHLLRGYIVFFGGRLHIMKEKIHWSKNAWE